jgi:hypothetical protein
MVDAIYIRQGIYSDLEKEGRNKDDALPCRIDRFFFVGNWFVVTRKESADEGKRKCDGSVAIA